MKLKHNFNVRQQYYTIYSIVSARFIYTVHLLFPISLLCLFSVFMIKIYTYTSLCYILYISILTLLKLHNSINNVEIN